MVKKHIQIPEWLSGYLKNWANVTAESENEMIRLSICWGILFCLGQVGYSMPKEGLIRQLKKCMDDGSRESTDVALHRKMAADTYYETRKAIDWCAEKYCPKKKKSRGRK